MNSNTTDTHYMRLALDEAEKGMGRTSPNPAVGAIIVKENTVIGRGYHKRAGMPHAEREALASLSSSPEGATMYVTLEPCNHTGRTPPCTEAIIENGITRVVVGMPDPNPHVAGYGMERLRAHGIDVVSGILEKQCREINYPFIKHSTTGLPWVIMKAGLSLDGRIAYQQGSGGKITGSKAQHYVHILRDRVDAILIGVDTALIDDPSLTTRLEGEIQGKDPVRIVLDSNLRLPADAKMLHQDSSAPTWIYCHHNASLHKQEELEKNGALVWRMDTGENTTVDLSDVFQHMGQENITSVLVEGGSRIHGTLVRDTLMDQVFLFFAPFFIGDEGVPVVRDLLISSKSEGLTFVEASVEMLGRDFLFSGIRNYP